MSYRYTKPYTTKKDGVEIIQQGIVRESDGACIPPDPSNTDYSNLMRAVEAGDVVIEPYVEPPPPPPPPTPLEVLAALFVAKGLLTQTEIDAILKASE